MHLLHGPEFFQVTELVHNLVLDPDAANAASLEPVIEETPETRLEDEKEQAIFKRKYVLHELIETEKDYVTNLGSIIDGYMNVLRGERGDLIQVPDDLKNGKDKIIFGNIENIYEWHKECVLPLIGDNFL